jgi:glycosyltransferase involved in cell wall biosynthesis
MKLNKKKEYKNIQYFFNNRSINSRSELIQKIKLSINNLINFKEIRVQRSFEKLKDEISVLLFSFNHQTTIKKTLESILAQKTSIPVKIYCFDDGSKDETQKVLKEYENYYKEKIKVIFSRTNTKLPLDLVLKSEINFNSKYWCILDGDDWWTDNQNLEKKITNLKNNKKIIGCVSTTVMLDENQINTGLIRPARQKFNKLDLIKNSRIESYYCHTSSILWKNYFYNDKSKLPFPNKYNKGNKYLIISDWFIFNQMLNLDHEISALNESLSVYNFHKKGIWSNLEESEKKNQNNYVKFLIFFYSPIKYKIFYIIVFLLRIPFLKLLKLAGLYYKIFRISPINKI